MSNKSIRGNADWYLELFQKFEQNMNGGTSEPVHAIRREAIAQFDQLAFPTMRDEDWKYTDLRPLTQVNFGLLPGAGITGAQIRKFLPKTGNDHLMVFLDGIFQEDISRGAVKAGQVVIQSLKQFRKENPEANELYFARNSKNENNSFTALNTAFHDDGVVVLAGKNAVFENPVHILYVSSMTDGKGMSSPRNLIVADVNSQIKLIETYASLGDNPHFTNAVTEIIVKANASVEHFCIQRENKASFHISSGYVVQESDSRYKSHGFNFGGKLVRKNIKANLDGQGIECILNGLYVGTEDQHIDNHTSIDHARPNCHSDELYKGILDDRAHGVFNGRIMVRPDAQKTNAIQSNNSVLLSDQASIDTKPQLEIFADDVRCTHGATIGQLDDDAYFYLRSRGIDKLTARKLLIYAFASDVIDRVEIEPVRAYLADLLAEKLHTIRPE